MIVLQTADKYPAITDLINNGGRLEIRDIYQIQVSIIAMDENDVIWQGKWKYENLEAALEDAEKGVEKWMSENY